MMTMMVTMMVTKMVMMMMLMTTTHAAPAQSRRHFAATGDLEALNELAAFVLVLVVVLPGYPLQGRCCCCGGALHCRHRQHQLQSHSHNHAYTLGH
jgi:hypothetical protein